MFNKSHYQQQSTMFFEIFKRVREQEFTEKGLCSAVPKNDGNKRSKCHAWYLKVSHTHSSNIWSSPDTPRVTYLHLILQPSVKHDSLGPVRRHLWSYAHVTNNTAFCQLNETQYSNKSLHLPPAAKTPTEATHSLSKRTSVRASRGNSHCSSLISLRDATGAGLSWARLVMGLKL